MPDTPSRLAAFFAELLLSIPSEISVHEVRLDPLYKPLWEHPRFQALLEQYGGK